MVVDYYSLVNKTSNIEKKKEQKVVVITYNEVNKI